MRDLKTAQWIDYLGFYMANIELKDIVKLLDGEVVCGERFLEREVIFGFASDLMSDVLTIDKGDLLLITGLTNIQTLRTAEMSDIQNILFVRNKQVSPDMIEVAEDNDIAIVTCKYSMFRAVTMLAQAGLKPVY